MLVVGWQLVQLILERQFAPANGMIVEGNVGIGTNSPTIGYALDVSGSLNITGNATLNGAITAPNANIFGRGKVGDVDANTQNILGNLIVGGDFTVNGGTTTISTTNLDVSTNMISLNNGLIGTPVNDSGILIYRGDASNVFMGWGETSNKFLFGTTAAVSTDIGDLSITPVDIEVYGLTANGNLMLSSGSLITNNGNTTISNTELGYLKDVSSNIQNQINTLKNDTTVITAMTTSSGYDGTITATTFDGTATIASTLANVGGNSMTFEYVGQSEPKQPNWVWGSNSGNGENNYIWNPSNFNVNSATYATYATNATNFSASGTISAASFNATSDLRLKENIHDLSNSLEKICAIRGVEYNWKADEAKKLHTGVIAQEVKEVIPEAVNSENEEKYSVDYNAIIGHLIEAVKTLKQEVDELKGQLKK